MTITICGSMLFSKQMLEKKHALEEQGITVYIPNETKSYLGRSNEEVANFSVRIKNTANVIREHYESIKKSDGILVLNYDKNNIKYYIGSNSFLEIGFAYVLEKKIYLLNPIPKIDFCSSEIKAMRPIVLNGDLFKITRNE